MLKQQFWLIIVCLFFLLSCMLPENSDNSNLVIRTPSSISPSMKIIRDNSTDISNPDFKKYQGRFRYDITIENNGREIAFFQLKNDEQENITVAPGSSLSIYLGIYFAWDSKTNDEEYNVYLAGDSEEGIYFSPGETKELSLKLNLTREQKVNTFYGDYLSSSTKMAAFTGAVMDASDSVLFSYTPLLKSGSTDSRLLRYDYASGYFIDYQGTVAGIGRLARVKGEPASSVYWHVTQNGIYGSNTGYDYSFNLLGSPATSSVNSYLPDILAVKSIVFNSNNSYFYFMDLQDSIIAASYFDSSWSESQKIDFSLFSRLFPEEPFLLDLEQDNDPDEDYCFIATKYGLFYLHGTLLQQFTDPDTKNEALNNCKKLIRINVGQANDQPLLIKKVRLIGNKIYLGTSQGVYRINKESGEWKDFTTSSGYQIFPVQKIEQLKEFKNSDVHYMEALSVKGDHILAVAATNRIWFKNIERNKIDSLTVWDGLPFIPYRDFSNSPSSRGAQFREHSLAPVNFILWDLEYDHYWIGTDYGLAAVDWDKLF